MDILENAICNDEKLLQAIKNSSFNVVRDIHNRICIIEFETFEQLEDEIERLANYLPDDRVEISTKEIYTWLDEYEEPTDFTVVDNDEDVYEAYDVRETLYADPDIAPHERVFVPKDEEYDIKEYASVICKTHGWHGMYRYLQDFKEVCDKHNSLSGGKCLIYDSQTGWSPFFGGGVDIVPNTCMEYDELVNEGGMYGKRRSYIGICLK